MSTNTPQTKHRWVSVYHWYNERIMTDQLNIHGRVRAELDTILRLVDVDILEELNTLEMDKDGYYDKILVEKCPECNKDIPYDKARQCWECEKWFHDDNDCINIDEKYKDPTCYLCLEVRASVHQ